MARAAPRPLRPRRPTQEGGSPKKEKGRGARSNQSSRYDRLARENARTSASDEPDAEWRDGWDLDDEPAPLKTTITVETPRTIINKVKSSNVDFDRSINPYRGCEHGCIYCFARPTHAFYGLSSGLDFETQIFVKPNAAKLLRKELSAKKYAPRFFAIGTNTDPYQPAERKFRLMRSVLKVLSEFNHPVSILTKSDLITRDIDLLAPMAARGLVRAMLSFTTMDRRLARSMEPRACTPAKRLKAIEDLNQAGIPTGVMTAPIIPGLNDHEMEALLEAAKHAGAEFAGYTNLRLPLDVADIFREWLQSDWPDRADKVMSIFLEMNGGPDFDKKRGNTRGARSVQAKLIHDRFEKTTTRLGLNDEREPMRVDLFRVPPEKTNQLNLFCE